MNDLWYTYDLPVIDALLDYAALTDADPLVAATSAPPSPRTPPTTGCSTTAVFDRYRAHAGLVLPLGSNIPKAGYGLLNLLLVSNAILPANDDLYRYAWPR